MSRKDYVLIAVAFTDIDRETELTVAQEVILRKLANNLADKLAVDNPAFRRDQFLCACGF